MYEPEAEEALGKWSSSRYAVLNKTQGIKPVLLPQNHSGTNFEKGVGTPFLVNRPDNPSKYTLLFTGWKTNDGTDRRLFAADFDPVNVKASNFRQLATYEDYPNSADNGVMTCHALWDTYNRNWIVTSSVNSSVSGVGYNLGAARFNEGFTELIETAEYHPISFKDGGFPLVPSEPKGAGGFMTAPPSDKDTLVEIDIPDYRNLPDGTASLTLNQDIVKIGNPGDLTLPDVHQTFMRNNQIVIIAECRLSKEGTWVHRAGIIPNEARYGTYPTDVRVPMSSSSFLANNFTAGHPHTGHPHYASLLGRPTLLFAWFRGLSSPGGPNMRHEIWAQCLPKNAFDPDRLAPKKALGPVDANAPSPWMPTYGRDVTVFWDAGESGDVNVDFAPTIIEGRENDTYHTETNSLGAAEENYTTYASPPPWMRVRTANFATPDIETWAIFR